MQLFDVPITGKKVSHRKDPVKHNVIEVNHAIAKKRYYPHRRLKKYMKINGTKRFIDCPYQSLEDIPAPYPRKYVEELLELGCNIQFRLL